jgi:hypothetical protein
LFTIQSSTIAPMVATMTEPMMLVVINAVSVDQV